MLEKVKSWLLELAAVVTFVILLMYLGMPLQYIVLLSVFYIAVLDFAKHIRQSREKESRHSAY